MLHNRIKGGIFTTPYQKHNRMNIGLSIDKSACIMCGRCVKVCPSRIFSVSDAGGKHIEADASLGCIECGHCVDACESGAVCHSLFGEDKRHVVDVETLPRPEAVIELIRSRRSNRAFRKEPVPKDMLDRIVEAAYLAPTASNGQELEFVVVTEPEHLRTISRYVMDSFSAMLRRMTRPVIRTVIRKAAPALWRYVPRFERMKSAFEAGEDPVLRGASAVIFICAPEKSRFGCQDANLAYQNGSLMAESLGVSQFYTGFVCTAVSRDRRGELNRMLGIEGRIMAGMALGMPAFRYPYYVDRKPLKVKYL